MPATTQTPSTSGPPPPLPDAEIATISRDIGRALVWSVIALSLTFSTEIAALVLGFTSGRIAVVLPLALAAVCGYVASRRAVARYTALVALAGAVALRDDDEPGSDEPT